MREALLQRCSGSGQSIPHTCMASASPCCASVLWCGSYTGIRAASVRQREGEPSPGVMQSPAVLRRPSRRALHARGSPWGIAAPACELNNAPACSAGGWQPAEQDGGMRLPLCSGQATSCSLGVRPPSRLPLSTGSERAGEKASGVHRDQS